MIEVTFPKLYPKQAEFKECDARYTIVEATTKAGKTVACLTWLLEKALTEGKPNRNYWWIAMVYPQAKIAYRRCKHWFRGYEQFAFNDSELFCTLPNGAVVWFKGADRPDSLYGEDVYAAVIDEASRCKEESWHAVRSTLTATRGPIKIIGNVRGRKNWAYKLARQAEAGAPDMAYFKLTTYDAAEAGIYPLEEIEDAKRVLPPPAFKELYLAEPADDGGNPFGLDAIDACIAAGTIPSANPVCYGVDLAKSVDWTVIVGLDPQGYVCSFERFQAPWGDTQRRILNRVGDVPTLVDSTGVGDPIVEAIQAEHPYIEGFHFSSTSKQQLMEGLASSIHRKRVHFAEGPIAQELRDFEYEYTRTGVRYSAPEGLHDDCVCALALAVRKFELMGLSVPFALIGSEQIAEEQGHEELTGDEGWVES